MHATVSHLTNVNRLVARKHTPELLNEPIDSTYFDFISKVTVLKPRYIMFTITYTSPLYELIMHATVSHLTNVNRVFARMHTPELRDEPID